jgi:L-threonylcarbamoyladenylate synthase
MRVVKLDDFEGAVREAAVVIAGGGAIVYPTDTVYALGVSAISAEGIGAAYAAKGRDEAKPLSLCVADIDQARAYVEIDARAEKLAAAYLPGALTLVCRSRNVLPAALQAGFPGIGIRVPGHPFGPALCRVLGHPITTTSANIAGQPPAVDRASAENAFASAPEQPSLLVDGGAAPIAQPSTVIDLCGADVKLIREGAMPFADIVRIAGAS